MTALLTGLASLLVFGGVILVHELGHFMAARHCGIVVEEFSIGFGPCLWSKTKNGTTYSLRLFPLGGYNPVSYTHLLRPQRLLRLPESAAGGGRLRNKSSPCQHQNKNSRRDTAGIFILVDLEGFEPLTSRMRTERSPN